MARTLDRRSKQPPAARTLPWRITRIKIWREHARLTQQDVADRLVEIDPDLDYTRTSVQRIETGNQRPPVIILEAMVTMFGAPDLTSMLDRTPEEAQDVQKFVALEPKERRRWARLIEADRDEGDHKKSDP